MGSRLSHRWQLADQRGSYAAWRQVAAQDAAYDHSGLAYLKAWQYADRDQREDQYRDFARLRPETQLSAMALHRALLALDKRPENDDKITAQNRQLQEHIAVQGQTLHDTITTYQHGMEQRLTTVNHALAHLHGRLEDTQQQLTKSQDQPNCKSLVDCALRVALDVSPGGSALRLGVSLLDKLPAITHFLHLR